MLAGLELVITLLAVFVAATVMGTVGFGFGLVAAPVILLFLEPLKDIEERLEVFNTVPDLDRLGIRWLRG